MGWFGHVSTEGHGRQLHTSNTAWSYGSSGNIGRSITLIVVLVLLVVLVLVVFVMEKVVVLIIE